MKWDQAHMWGNPLAEGINDDTDYTNMANSHTPQ